VLATLAVVLWAYGLYALFSFIFRRQGGYIRGRSRWRKLTWLSLVGGASVGLGLIFWCFLSPDKIDQRLKLAGFLGTVYAEGWPDRVDRLKEPPVKSQNQKGSEQPVYALLHPETPDSQIESEKKLPKPRPSRAASKGQSANLQDKAGKIAKVNKAQASPSKKDKMAAKSRVKKKNRSSAAEGRQANAG
jgi:outer membrane biosynthesis protein TonB